MRLVAVLVMLAALVVPGRSWAQPGAGLPPIMAVSEVRPGMRGIGRTVIKGQQIEQFDFEVVGTLRGGGGVIPVKHLVLFRIFGPVADRSGGTAAGMSGSPLYINGKLMGALSAGYLFQPEKRDLALATPIEEMLPLLALPAGSPRAVWPRTYVAERPLTSGAARVERLVIAESPAQARAIEAALPGVTAFVPAAFDATASGLSPRARRILQRALGIQQPILPFYQETGDPTDFRPGPITGGSSVGILQAQGDLNFGGICTVTLRVGDRLLICGHPWDNLGEVEYVLTASEIITVVRTLERPFKEGNLGQMIGKIDQDRGPGIRGILGQMPRLFAVRVTVIDQDTGRRVEKGTQVVRRPDLAKIFATAMALTAIDRSRDALLGGGTATVTTSLRGKGLPRVLTRKNLVYNSRDIALASILELPQALNFLLYNDFVQVDPIDVSIEIGLTSRRHTAALLEAQVEHREVAPGQSLRVRLNLRPFQEDAVTSRVIDVQIPQNFPRGPAVLVVGSAGPRIPTEFPLEERVTQFLLEEPQPSPVDNLDDAIRLFEDFGKNTDILIQLVPFGLPSDGTEFVKFDVFAGRVVRTDWVIQGEVQVPILVR
ncbi:MAG: hypothetical protein QN117_00430 [Armatimonadota bacterium]|nr:hypothetical protein [Armatimonadota bacterium]MDR7493204.1 hypothetical protein [Armatimonadota bacterium]MDR7499443.1 hypothetical protein [Armatimonadota bacterium]MDR7545756.1 hypothetical protein [Armatimonadota bacterium]MDR7551435.1 hypothetical protein [Armatimonadota bacterium]